MVAVQLVGALQHKLCRPVQGRPRDEEGQRLEQVSRPLRVVERLFLGFCVVEVRQPLQVGPQMARR
jgi:hypothetical protein